MTAIHDRPSAGCGLLIVAIYVLRFLHEHRRHHSADEITEALAGEDASLMRGSVDNLLNKLQTHGLITLADVGPGRALYEAGSPWHHHFVCRECDAVLDVACVVAQNPCLQAALEGSEVDAAQVIFRGRCPACAASPAS